MTEPNEIFVTEYGNRFVSACWDANDFWVYAYRGVQSPHLRTQHITDHIILSHEQAVELAKAILTESRNEQKNDTDGKEQSI